MKKLFTPEAEILNARLAMIGFVAAIGAYFTTGQVIPGIWCCLLYTSPSPRDQRGSRMPSSA